MHTERRGDDWAFVFDVKFPNGVDVEAVLVTWARRYVDNVTPHAGGTPGACTFRMSQIDRLGLTGTSFVIVIPTTSAVTATGVLTEETITPANPIQIDDAVNQNRVFRCRFELTDCSTRGQTSRVHWVKFRLGLRKVGQVLY
jgi:hypothetical protein